MSTSTTWPAWIRVRGDENFVHRVGLVSTERPDVRAGERLPLTHMGPPLETGTADLPVDAAGSVPLTADEIKQVEVFIAELASEYEAQRMRARTHYVIHPHAAAVRTQTVSSSAGGSTAPASFFRPTWRRESPCWTRIPVASLWFPFRRSLWLTPS